MSHPWRPKRLQAQSTAHAKALRRPELDQPTDSCRRVPSASPYGPPIKVRDPAEQRMIDEAIAKKRAAQ